MINIIDIINHIIFFLQKIFLIKKIGTVDDDIVTEQGILSIIAINDIISTLGHLLKNIFY